MKTTEKTSLTSMADCVHLEFWQRRSNCWIDFIVVNRSQRIWDCAILTGQNLKHGIQRSQCILCKLSGWSSYFGAEVIPVPYAPIKFLVAFLTFVYECRMFWIDMPLEIPEHNFCTCVVIFRLSDIVAVMAVSQTFGCLEFFCRIFDFVMIQVLGFDKYKSDESFGIRVQFSVEHKVAKILSTG